MAASKQYRSANESCQARIPLFPLRYSAHPRPKGGVDYAYELPTLEKGFSKLSHAQYGLRRVGAGFVYLFDETEGDLFVWRVHEHDGTFIELQSKHRSLQAALKDYIPGNTVPHIWARECSVVHLLLTDTLLTEQKIREIQDNRDGIRDRLATTINMKVWKADEPSKHSFSAEKLGQLVEDFKATDLGFSPWAIKSPKHAPDALVRGMKLVAPVKQVAVVMYDHIALVQDLGGFYQLAREEMERYNAEPDEQSGRIENQRHQKKMIADLISRIYETAYSADKDLAGKGEEALEQAIERDTRQQEFIRQRILEHSKHMERIRPRSSENQANGENKNTNMPVNPIGMRAEVVARSAKLYVRHVKESERVKFLQDYAATVEKKHRNVLDRKNDRCKWLNSYQNSNNALSLGSTFTRYDSKNECSSTSHAVAFASCIEGMIWGTEETPKGAKDSERELFGKWWTLPWHENPILTNIDYDKGLVDALWDASKVDVGLDLVGSKGLFPAIRYGAIHLIMNQVGVYVLSRFPHRGEGRVWHGAARNSVSERIYQLAGTGSVEDANRLVDMLEQRYQDRIVQRTLTRQEVIDALEDAAGFPRTVIATGSIAMGAGDTMEVLVWSNVNEGVRAANPFLRRAERFLSGGVAFLSFTNLIRAALSFDMREEKAAYSKANLASAFMAVGSGINGLLHTTRPLMPQAYLRASVSGAMLRQLVRVGTMRLFGFLGAISDAVAQGFKSRDARRIGNSEAARCYAIASFGLGLGGAALTVGGGTLMAAGTTMATTVTMVPVWGWIAAGAILLGIGVWYLLKGDQAEFTPLSFWLNDGSFGKHEVLGREKKDVAKYETLEQENQGYVKAMYAPQKIEEDWHITSNTLTFRIAYPLGGVIPHFKGSPENTQSKDVRLVRLPGEEKIESGGCTLKYQIYGLRKGSGFRYTIKPKYTPFLLEEELATSFTFSDSDAPWYY